MEYYIEQLKMELQQLSEELRKLKKEIIEVLQNLYIYKILFTLVKKLNKNIKAPYQ